MIRNLLVFFLCVAIWPVAFVQGGDRAQRAGAGAAVVSAGFDALYNLDYDVAIAKFRSYTELNRSDPAGHVYVALAYWTQELSENNELELDRFLNDAIFRGVGRSEKGGRNERAVVQAAGRAIDLAASRLQRQPADEDPLYYLGAAYGVMAGYQATVKKSGWKSFRNGAKSFKYHQQLLKLNPAFYDAYLTQGLYNYITGSLPFSLKILAFVFGHRGDKQEGLRQIQIAADKGSYVSDDARLALAVLFAREKRYEQATHLLRELASKYPRNHLVELDRANLYLRLGRKTEALALYQEILAKSSQGLPHFNSVPLEKLQNRIKLCMANER